jgi:hypothetical protein
MRYAPQSLTVLLILAACSGGQRSGDGAAIAVSDSSGAPLGTVRLAHSCTDSATVHLGRGLALLHSMT